MQDAETLKDLLLLNRLSLTGAKSICRLLEEGILPAEILRRIREENFLQKQAALEQLLPVFNPESEIQTAEKMGAWFLTVLDENYPKLLRAIADPPLVLYGMGCLVPEDRAALAVVGTRHPSLYGAQQAAKFSREISERGFTVVSGFALGIDQAAHTSALEVSYGRTVAVLGCGLDIHYPSGSRLLREKIKERGAVLTEYAFGTEPRAENFPRRNRIIAGLSLGVLVVEANSRSGSLITAHLAAEEGREVFAIPGSVEQPGSRGTHHLIKEGAQLVEAPEEVVNALGCILQNYSKEIPAGPVMLPKPKQESSTQVPLAAEKDLFEEIETPESKLLHVLEEPMNGDEIADKVPALAGQIGMALTLLEMKGRVKRGQDGRYARMEVK